MFTLLELKCTIMVCPKKNYLTVDQMSHIPNGKPPIRVDDKFANENLLLVDSTFQWSKYIVSFLERGFKIVKVATQCAKKNIMESAYHQLIVV